MFDPDAISTVITTMDVPCIHAAVAIVACDAYRKALGKLIEEKRIEVISERSHARRASEAQVRIYEAAIDQAERFDAQVKETMLAARDETDDPERCIYRIHLFLTLDRWMAQSLTASQRYKREQMAATGDAAELRGARSRAARLAAYLAAGSRDAADQMFAAHAAVERRLRNHVIH